MCIMAYLGADVPLPLIAWRDPTDFAVHQVDAGRLSIVQGKLTQLHLAYLLAYRGCGCGFGQTEAEAERTYDALRDYIRGLNMDTVTIYAFWDDLAPPEPAAPRHLRLDDLRPGAISYDFESQLLVVHCD
jgi:hypothetical protein